MLNKYLIYKQASNLGLHMSATDMDVETLQILSDFNAEFTKLSEAKNKKPKTKKP